MPIDRNGTPVHVGTRVRLLKLAAFLERDLPADEWQRLQTMVGEVFEVYEIDEYGSAWVEKWWHESSDVVQVVIVRSVVRKGIDRHHGVEELVGVVDDNWWPQRRIGVAEQSAAGCEFNDLELRQKRRRMRGLQSS